MDRRDFLKASGVGAASISGCLNASESRDIESVNKSQNQSTSSQPRSSQDNLEGRLEAIDQALDGRYGVWKKDHAEGPLDNKVVIAGSVEEMTGEEQVLPLINQVGGDVETAFYEDIAPEFAEVYSQVMDRENGIWEYGPVGSESEIPDGDDPSNYFAQLDFEVRADYGEVIISIDSDARTLLYSLEEEEDDTAFLTELFEQEKGEIDIEFEPAVTDQDYHYVRVGETWRTPSGNLIEVKEVEGEKARISSNMYSRKLEEGDGIFNTQLEVYKVNPIKPEYGEEGVLFSEEEHSVLVSNPTSL